MKKIYASMLVLALGAGITAGARTIERANFSFDGMADVKKSETVGKLLSTDFKVANKANKVKANAGEEWTNLGQGVLIDGIFTGEEFTVTVEESTSTPGSYRVPDYFSQLVASTEAFYVDATDPTCVSVPEQETGIVTTLGGDQGPLTILSFSEYLKMEGYSTEDIKAEYPDIVITFENGIVNFPDDAIVGYVNEGESGLYLLNSEMVLVLPGVEYVPTWGETGDGQMLNGFLAPLFLEEVSHEPTDIVIQKNNRKEGVYRIIAPWSFLTDSKGQPLDGNPLEFNISDPTAVLCQYQNTGISVGDRGIMYVGNEYGMFYETLEEYKTDLQSGDADSPWTYDAETRKINIPAPYGMYFNWPNWDEKTEDGRRQGDLAYYTSAAFQSWILLPEFSGITSVTVDSNNAEAEYYNIQGVRVNNPVAGQLYIVKKGNEVRKQIMR